MNVKTDNVIKVNINELATPINLMRKFPDCNMTSSQIGYAFHIGAVKGIKPRGARTSLIYIQSFVNFLEYRDNLPNLEVSF
jgi:hypothetical protein